MRFPGIIPAVTTPFRSDDTVDFDALAANVDALMAAGVHGIVAVGTMGEGSSLDLNEREGVIGALGRAIAGRVPLIAGVAAPTATIGARYADVAQTAGAGALMVLPPLNYNGDIQEIVAFYRAIAHSSDLPIIAYNNPAACGVELSVAAMAAIAESVDSVVAIKECSGDARNIAAIIGAAPEGFEVLVGGDDFALEGFCAGATGWISGVANVIPAECVALYDACRAGDLAVAQTIYQRMLPLARLDMTPKLVQFFKGAMDHVGFTGGPSRAPRLPLTESDQCILDEAMTALQREAVS